MLAAQLAPGFVVPAVRADGPGAGAEGGRRRARPALRPLCGRLDHVLKVLTNRDGLTVTGSRDWPPAAQWHRYGFKFFRCRNAVKTTNMCFGTFFRSFRSLAAPLPL